MLEREHGILTNRQPVQRVRLELGLVFGERMSCWRGRMAAAMPRVPGSQESDWRQSCAHIRLSP